MDKTASFHHVYDGITRFFSVSIHCHVKYLRYIINIFQIDLNVYTREFFE